MDVLQTSVMDGSFYSMCRHYGAVGHFVPKKAQRVYDLTRRALGKLTREERKAIRGRAYRRGYESFNHISGPD